MLTITYTSKYERWVDSLNLHVWSSRSRATAFVLLYCVVPLLAALDLSLLALPRSNPLYLFAAERASSAIVALIVVVIFWGMRATNRRTQYAKLWPPEITDQRNVLTFSQEGISAFSNGIGEANLKWSAVRKVVRNSRMILLYTGPCSFIVVPLEGLADTNKQELETLLNQHVRASH